MRCCQATADIFTHNARQWSRLGSPLRPTDADIEFTRTAVVDWARAKERTDATMLVMGVTPELCTLATSVTGRLIAVDKSAEMIRSCWTTGDPERVVVRADWQRMPISAAAIDIAFGDGSFTPLAYPSGYRICLAELRRVLRPTGRFVCRCFVQPPVPETADDVLAALDRRAVGSIHALKWRLAMALQTELESGVAVRDVLRTLEAEWPRLDRLAQHLGWAEEEVRTIETYRNASTLYTFPTLAEYVAVFAAAGLSVADILTPDYELGDRCPTLVMDTNPS